MFEGFGFKIDNPEQKYYWLVYVYDDDTTTQFEEVTSLHPFKWIKGEDLSRERYDKTLLNWKEIEKWEYDLFNA